MPKRNPVLKSFARALRANQTSPEGLLWSVLRARQLCNLKFRRQFVIDPFIADFACPEHKLIVELDGDSHDFTFEQDESRTGKLEKLGWTVIRFDNEEVMYDAESVAIAICQQLDLEYEFKPRGRVSG